MGRGTFYNAIVSAIEAGERLTRAQGRSLLAYAQMQSERADSKDRRISELGRALEDEHIMHEMDREMLRHLIMKWNALIDMLHTFLGHKLYDEGGDVAEQYRQALEKKMKI